MLRWSLPVFFTIGLATAAAAQVAELSRQTACAADNQANCDRIWQAGHPLNNPFFKLSKPAKYFGCNFGTPNNMAQQTCNSSKFVVDVIYNSDESTCGVLIVRVVCLP